MWRNLRRYRLLVLFTLAFLAVGAGWVSLASTTAGAAVSIARLQASSSGSVTVTPLVSQHSPWFNEDQVRLANTAQLSALSVTIVVQRTAGVSFSGQYNTVGGQILQSNSSTSSAITYQFSLATGQTLGPGSGWIFAAQSSGNGTTHPTGGDTYAVTFTTGGVTSTQSGHLPNVDPLP
jgi:hypothetical protein